MDAEKTLFTEDDLDACWPYYKSYMVDLLNGEYPVENAREDLAGLIGSRFDLRVTGDGGKGLNPETEELIQREPDELRHF